MSNTFRLLFNACLFLALATSVGCKSSQPRGGDRSQLDTEGAKGKGGDPKKKQKVDYLFVEAATQQMQGNPEAAMAQFREVTKLDPSLDAAWYNIAKIAFELGDYPEAIRHGKEAINLEPDNFWYYALMADSYQRAGEYSNGIKMLEQITQRFPDHTESWFNLSQLHLQSKDPTNAILVLDELEKLEGPKEQIVFRKYQMAMQSGNTEKAEVEVKKLLDSHPSNPDYLKYQYELQMALGQKEEANKTLERIIAANPTDPFALFSLADYHRNQGNTAESDEFLFRAFESGEVPIEGKLQIMSGLYGPAATNADIALRLKKLAMILKRIHPNEPETLGVMGDVYLQNEQPDSAAIYYRASLEKDGSNISAWEELLALDLRQEDFKNLVKDANDAMDYFPDHIPILYYYGVGSARTEEDDDAIFAFERILKIGGNLTIETQACINLGEIFNRLGKHAKADVNMDKALELGPDDPLVLNNYAWYLALRKDRLDDAEKMVKRALEITPGSVAYLDTYGWVLYQKGSYIEAEKFLLKAIEAGGDAEILEHYGDTLYKLGRKEDAEKYWAKAISMGAKFNLAKKRKEVEEQ